MAEKLIFLSHIHEESVLARLIQSALEEEFGGFVDVFVSSDGSTIPVGTNFLKRIEDGLINCVAAIYLISPISVKRNWINFELGAVWIRNAISQRQDGAEIPTLPFCHSGILPDTLPSPLNNLNAVTASQRSQLELAFRSIQTSVGGRGKLRTDFDALAASIIKFEGEYTRGSNLLKLLSLLGGNKKQLVEKCMQHPSEPWINLDCRFQKIQVIEELQKLQSKELNGYMKFKTSRPAMPFTQFGAVSGANVEIELSIPLILEFKELLLA